MRYLQFAHIANLVFLTYYYLLDVSLISWIIWVFYVIVFLGTLNHHIRWVRLAMVPPLLIFLFTALPVAYRIFGFFWYKAPFLVSPAMIFVIFVIGLLPALSSAVVLSLYWFHRRAIFGAA